MNLENLKAQMENLANNGLNLKAVNYVRIDDPATVLPTSGDVVLKAGTTPEIVSQHGVNPWLRYATSGQVKVSKTALLGTGHYAKTSSPCSFRDLLSRTKYEGISLADAWGIETVQVNGIDYAIAIPKVDLKITFSDGGTVYTPRETSGSDIKSFRQKDHFVMLTISKA
jgi:hypothetical protein